MSYGEKVFSRVMDPGFMLIAAGAVLAYASGLLTRGIEDAEKRQKCSLLLKGAGCVGAFVGAVLLFT